MSDKPVKTKPHFYAVMLNGMQEIAKSLGYNLILHGSLSRDFDLVAIPWVDTPAKHIELIEGLCEFLGVGKYVNNKKESYLYSVLGGGRHSYVINLNRGGRYNGYVDEQYYIDISITPLADIDKDKILTQM